MVHKRQMRPFPTRYMSLNNILYRERNLFECQITSSRKTVSSISSKYRCNQLIVDFDNLGVRPWLNGKIYIEKGDGGFLLDACLR